MTKPAVAVLGIDLGKNSCSVVGLDEAGRVVLRRRFSREGVVRLAADMPACVMAVEACCGAHHLGRVLRDQGHEVRLMSPEYVQPYVKAQKNDERDAEAIAEAVTRPTMRFVELKSEAQLDMQRSEGFLAMSGQIVDATIVAAPKQRNTIEEKKAIKEGRVPDDWADKPARLA